MLIAQLINRSNVIFPCRDYLAESAVRHARRQWVQIQTRLAERGMQTYPLLRQPDSSARQNQPQGKLHE